MKTEEIEDLPKDIRTGKKIISVYGIGFVGTAITSVWLRAGATVIAVDKNNKIVNSINDKKISNTEPKAKEAFIEAINNKRLWGTRNIKLAAKKSQIKIVSVPVGIKNHIADLSNVYSVIDDITSNLNRNDIIIMTPTVPIGTSNQLIKRMESKTKMKANKDFFYIYSPERIAIGQAIADIENNYPAIISGVGQKSLKIAKKIFGMISSKSPIVMTSTKAAEAEKLIEGLYRDVNIALVNQIAILCEKEGIDIWEIRNAANSQPFSNLHKAGIGVGGYCIPIYPHLLLQTAKNRGINLNLASISREINEAMPAHCVNRILTELKQTNKKKKAAILGLSFRGDIPDKRLSPTYDIVNELLANDIKVTVHDPFFDNDSLLPKSVKVTKNLKKAIRKADIIIVATNHNQYNKLNDEFVVKNSKSKTIVFDGRGILDRKNFTKIKLITIGQKNY